MKPVPESIEGIDARQEFTGGSNCRPARGDGHAVSYAERQSDVRMTLADGFNLLSDDLAVLHMDDAVRLGGQFVIVSHDNEGGSTGFVQLAYQPE